MMTSSIVEMKVPDLGVNGSLKVSRIHVKPGDVVTVRHTIATLESDKSSIDLPSSWAGIINEVKVKEGEAVSVGCCLLTLTPNAKVSVKERHPPSHKGSYEVVIIGCGPGGASAALQASSLGLEVAIIEGSNVGGVCLNEGCIPSKSLLHLSSSISEGLSLRDFGVNFHYPHISVDRMKQKQKETINQLSNGLRRALSCAKVKIIKGTASFLSTEELEVSGSESCRLKFGHAIIATGSASATIKKIKPSARIVFSAQALSLEHIPSRMLIIGTGIIGLELATIYSMFGTAIDMMESKCRLDVVDEDLMLCWKHQNTILFKNMMFNCDVLSIEDKGGYVKVVVRKGGLQEEEVCYDLVLICVGRQPNTHSLGLEIVKIKADSDGFIRVNDQMRTSVPNILAVGDVVGRPMLAHKAIHQGRIAAEAIVNPAAVFQPLQIPTVLYTNPEIAWTGLTESECLERNIPFFTRNICWSCSGRAVAQSWRGSTKLVFDSLSRKLLGGGMVGKLASELVNEVGLAIELGCDAADIANSIHAHPTLSELFVEVANSVEVGCSNV